MPGEYERRDPNTLKIGESFATRNEMSPVFGGTPLKGITYNADDDWVILVSSPTGHDTYDNQDGWMDAARARYRYSGEWHGCGDMRMSGGNAAINQRSPRIFLFVREGDAFVFRGRFRMYRYERETAVRPQCRHQHAAIRSDLVRA